MEFHKTIIVWQGHKSYNSENSNTEGWWFLFGVLCTDGNERPVTAVGLRLYLWILDALCHALMWTRSHNYHQLVIWGGFEMISTCLWAAKLCLNEFVFVLSGWCIWFCCCKLMFRKVQIKKQQTCHIFACMCMLQILWFSWLAQYLFCE